MNLSNKPALLDQLAASYALGTLRGGARRRFESLAQDSVIVRAQALIWQERMAAMTELETQQRPSPNVWKCIENLVQAQRTGAAVQPAMVSATAMIEKMRKTLQIWRMAAAGAALACLISLMVVPWQGTPHIEYVAVLASEKSDTHVLVTFDPHSEQLTLKRVGDFQEGADKSLQLWALPAAQTGQVAAGPRSLGVLGREKWVHLAALENQINGVPALAISLEPKGGVPLGQGPSGPILFTGALLKTTL
jgi:anti-sigma-K factor RskA